MFMNIDENYRNLKKNWKRTNKVVSSKILIIKQIK